MLLGECSLQYGEKKTKSRKLGRYTTGSWFHKNMKNIKLGIKVKTLSSNTSTIFS
jgi:hypothetical protein